LKFPTIEDLFRQKLETTELGSALRSMARNKSPYLWFSCRYFRAHLRMECLEELAKIKHRRGVSTDEEIRGIYNLSKDREELHSYMFPYGWTWDRELLTESVFDEQIVRFINMGVKPHSAVEQLLDFGRGKFKQKGGRKPTKKHVALLALIEYEKKPRPKWREIADKVCPNAAHRPHKGNSNCVGNLYREVNHLRAFMKEYDRNHT